MLFNSYIFILLFLPVTLLVFFLAGKKSRELAMLWLVIASLFFYGWWNPNLLSLITASIGVNYLIGQQFGKDGLTGKFPILVVGICLNLIALGYFKYANFFVDNVSQLMGVSFYLEKIVLPLAISFFTFQQITYLVDSYKGETEEHNFIHYCLFVTFFPQLIAGPIVHHREMLGQFTKKYFYQVDAQCMAMGLTIFSIGLFKKVILADGISVYAIAMFGAAADGIQLYSVEYWTGAVAYSLQLYFDFSGYSDMAVGLGLLFGIKLPLNFNSPYQASSIIDFWTRWHMTLSRFLKDYLYVPLGGNRHGRTRKYWNLMITMLLGGLWHGAGWTFVVWGGLHGIYLIVNHLWRDIKLKMNVWPQSYVRTRKIISRVVTLLAVLIGWVIFRSENLETAAAVLDGMFIGIGGGEQALFEVARAMPAILLLLGIALFSPNMQQLVGYRSASSREIESVESGAQAVWTPGLYWALGTGLLLGTSILFLARQSEFLYFQF